jgi:sorbitol/mannitol transport system permease protein
MRTSTDAAMVSAPEAPLGTTSAPEGSAPPQQGGRVLRLVKGKPPQPEQHAMHRPLARLLLAPAVGTLFLWMIVPLLMTIYFSFIRYNLMQPGEHGFAGLMNYEFFVTDPSFMTAVGNTLLLLGSVIAITVVMGIGIALLVNEPFPGRGIVRVLLISPFFVMPTVNALLWKHMMMNPIYGVLAQVSKFFGAQPIDWLTDYPLFSVIVMVAWQWLPFAVLIFITALQSMNREQLEAARMDGANAFQQFRFLVLPHLSRAIAVVVMIEMIFLLSVFAEIFTTTGGGPGDASTNIAFLIFKQALLNFDVGVASAGALFAVLLANVAAIFLIRMVGKNLER